jgi:hypothetical protein
MRKWIRDDDSAVVQDVRMQFEFRHAHIFLLIAAVMFASCNQSDPQRIIVRIREPQRVNDCHVYLDSVQDDQEHGKPIRRAFLLTACGVPESALKGQWWGNGLQPPGFSLDIGDCMPLEDTYYCLEDLHHYESATFRPTYFKPEHPKGKLRRIR